MRRSRPGSAPRRASRGVGALLAAGALVAALAGCGSGSSHHRGPVSDTSAGSSAASSTPASTATKKPTHSTSHAAPKTSHAAKKPAADTTAKPAPHLSAPAPTTHPAPPPAAPAPPPAAAPPPAHVGGSVGSVYAIGDSVMIDAESSLQADIPGINIDAAVSRQVGTGIATLQQLAGSGQLANNIVFGLGTNGTFDSAQFAALVAAVGGRHLVVVTGHCPYCSWTPGNNAMIHSSCNASTHCSIADFEAQAEANPSWFVGDGVHMPSGGPGAAVYAQLVAAAL